MKTILVISALAFGLLHSTNAMAVHQCGQLLGSCLPHDIKTPVVKPPIKLIKPIKIEPIKPALTPIVVSPVRPVK